MINPDADDGVQQLRSMERHLAAVIDPTAPPRIGRPYDRAVATCAHTYVTLVLNALTRADTPYLTKEQLMALDERARWHTAVPSWRLRQFLRRQGVPLDYVARNARVRKV